MTLYLILHKVSGKPALDIAQRCDDMGIKGDPAPWWIIPTSGHRAYPVSWHQFNLLDAETIGKFGSFYDYLLLGKPDPQFDEAEDHYPISAPASPSRLSSLLSLIRKPIKRRTL